MPPWVEGLTGRLVATWSFFGFLWRQRMWWLIPCMIVLFVLGVLLVVGQSSILAPFIYTLF